MTVLKGLGFDSTNARNKLGTSIDTISFAAQIVAADGLNVSAEGASITGGTTSDTLTVTGNASVGGDLLVTGDVVSRGAVNLVVQDNFIDLNFANATDLAEAGGLTVQMNRNAGFTAGSATAFSAGVDTVSNPTFTYSGAGTAFAVRDVVVISGATESGNDGLYIVSAVSGASLPQTVTIKGIGTDAVVGSTPWAQNQFATETGSSAIAFKTDMFVQMVADGSASFMDGASTPTAYAKGTFLTAYKANATEESFSTAGSYTTVESTLQGAYDGGNTLTTATSTDIAFTLASGNFNVIGPGKVDLGLAGDDLSSFEVGAGAIDFNATGAVDIDSSGAGISLDGAGASNFTTSAGILTLSGVGLNLAGGNAEIDVTTTGALDLNSGAFELDASTLSIDATDAANFSATEAALTVSTITSGTLAVSSAATLDIDGVAVTVDASGGLSLDGAGAASNLTSDQQNLTVATTTSGTLAVSSDATLDIDGVTVTIDSSGSMDIISATTMTIKGTGVSKYGDDVATLDFDGAGAVTQAGMTSFTIDPSAGIALTGAAASSLTTSAGALTLTSAAAATWSTTAGGLSLDGAVGVSIQGNAGEVDITTAGTVDINGGTVTIDGATAMNLKLTADVASTAILEIGANNSNAAGEGEINFHADAFTLALDMISGDANLEETHIVIVSNNSGVPKVMQANADAIATSRIAGVCLITAADTVATRVALQGSMAVTRSTGPVFAASGANIGSYVYLDEVDGHVTLTPPTAANSCVVQVGIILQRISDTMAIIAYQPMLIIENN